MKLLAFPLLADENIHPGVVNHLKQAGLDIVSVKEIGLAGKSDLAIMQFAFDQGRAILTHDSDFGRLTYMAQHDLLGIIFLRPGHIRPEFTIETLQYLESRSFDISTPFIVVAERVGKMIRVCPK